MPNGVIIAARQTGAVAIAPYSIVIYGLILPTGRRCCKRKKRALCSLREAEVLQALHGPLRAKYGSIASTHPHKCIPIASTSAISGIFARSLRSARNMLSQDARHILISQFNHNAVSLSSPQSDGQESGTPRSERVQSGAAGTQLINTRRMKVRTMDKIARPSEKMLTVLPGKLMAIGKGAAPQFLARAGAEPTSINRQVRRSGCEQHQRTMSPRFSPSSSCDGSRRFVD